VLGLVFAALAGVPAVQFFVAWLDFGNWMELGHTAVTIQYKVNHTLLFFEVTHALDWVFIALI
jgi:hypothetical protein